MRIWPNDHRVHERRALSLARVFDGLSHHIMAGDQVATVDLLHEQIGESAHELRDRSAGGVHFDRNRDRVAVVLDEINDGELQVARRVEALPKLPFARLPFAGRAQHDLVFLKALRYSEQLRAEGPFSRT